MAPQFQGVHPSGVETSRGHRPLVFLVTTMASSVSIRRELGSAAYSYYFVCEALAPVLEAVGTWQMIDHPESRLDFAARCAEAEGCRPVHLAIRPLQDVYLSPSLPNIVFPFWEFPDLPDHDFTCDTRQNWVRVSRCASLVMTACQFTAGAFARAGVRAPVAVVPVPLAPEAFQLPDWDPSYRTTLTCRHEVLSPAGEDLEDLQVTKAQRPEGEKGRAWRIARRGFQRVAPWLGPHTIAQLTRCGRLVARVRSTGLRRAVFLASREGYSHYVRRWLSDEAEAKITAAKQRVLGFLGLDGGEAPDPLLPAGPLVLGEGLVYLTVFNVGDKRKNYVDLLSAFLIAFRERPDVTLVIKLVTNPTREHHEASILRASYQALGLDHRCRVAVITEYLSEGDMAELMRVAAYYVNASLAEGACLPLMRALAGGRPAIAPDHTAMADYMDSAVGFVPESDVEPTWWPHDPERRIKTYRYRPRWSDLRDAFLASAETIEHDPERYRQMAAAARSRMAAHAARAAVEEALRAALVRLPEEPLGAPGWVA